jgi:hypothetical protein
MEIVIIVHSLILLFVAQHTRDREREKERERNKEINGICLGVLATDYT